MSAAYREALRVAVGSLVLASSCGPSREPWSDPYPGCALVTGAQTFLVEALLPIENSSRALIRVELCHDEQCVRVDLDSAVAASRSPGQTLTSGWSWQVPEQSAYLVADSSEARWKLHLGVDGTLFPAGDPWHLQVVSLTSGRLLVDATDTVPEYVDGQFPCAISPGSIARLDAGPATPDLCDESSLPVAHELPVLHYAFEGDSQNSGTLGPNHDGSVRGMTPVAGKVGRGLRPTTLDNSYFDASLSDFASKGGFTVGVWFQASKGTTGELLTGLGILVDTAGLASLYRGASMKVAFHYAPGLWHHLALRSTALDGSVDVLLDGLLVGVVKNEERAPLWRDARESLTLGAGADVDELVVFDYALDDAALCQSALGGHWCAGTTVCGLP